MLRPAVNSRATRQPFARNVSPIFASQQQNSHIVTEEENYTTLLRKCTEKSDLDHGKAIHARLIKGHVPFTLFLRNHVLNMYVKCGDITTGLKLFDEMPARNVVSWSAVIAGLVQRGHAKEALLMFCTMYSEGMVKPNEFTLVSALHACSLYDRLWTAYLVYGLIVKLGFEGNVYLMNAFLTTLVRHGKVEEASEAFEVCSGSGRDIVSWNAMMAGYLQYCYSEVPRFWCRMVREGVKPDNYTFASVFTGLAALCDVGMGMQVHGQLVKSGYGSEICVGNSLADMYIKSQRVEDGFRAFSEMPLKDVCSWTEMAAGCLHGGDPTKALEVIAKMRIAGVKPNRFTLATAFNACANLASLEEGKKVHSLRLKLGDDMDVCVDNALLDMYVKCGCMDGAWVVFKSLKERSIVSWTTMIMGCAQNGLPREALKIYEEMRMEGFEPNYVTFICVLYACSQGGFVDEGWKYFASMSQDYGISPGEDHFVCMVNLLGRTGHIKEAEELILGMPFQPSLLVWQTLLGACQIHGDVETGRRAAEHALNLDKKDPSTYVLLSNMFASLSNWDDVGILRKLMDHRDVRKVPGSSWIEREKGHLEPPVLGGIT